MGVKGDKGGAGHATMVKDRRREEIEERVSIWFAAYITDNTRSHPPSSSLIWRS
jgi:hypothetical protein